MSQRASDRDREQTAELLRHAAGDGRLTVDELDERMHAALAAVSRDDLAELTRDVQPVTGRPVVRAGAEGERRLVSFMSGRDRLGRWRIAPRLRVINVMGGSDLDLEQAELTADRTEITVFSLMGGGDVYVPESLNLEVSETAILGGNDIEVGNQTPDPGGPVVHLRIISIMAGMNVSPSRRRTRRPTGERHTP